MTYKGTKLLKKETTLRFKLCFFLNIFTSKMSSKIVVKDTKI